MKNLKGININSENLLKNEDLQKLRGGEDLGNCYKCYSLGGIEGCHGYLGGFYFSECLTEFEDVQEMCQLNGYSTTGCVEIYCNSNCAD